MKTLFFTLSLLVASTSFASSRTQCDSAAEKAAAQVYLKQLGVPENEFFDSMGTNYSCKLKADPRQEEFQYSSGVYTIRVQLTASEKSCDVTSTYFGPEEDEVDDAILSANCL